MGTEGETSAVDMAKINVRVPESLLDEIDEAFERRGYTNRSEAIRDALRDWVDPPIRLSEEVLEDLAESRAQRERGETIPLDDVLETYDVQPEE